MLAIDYFKRRETGFFVEICLVWNLKEEIAVLFGQRDCMSVREFPPAALIIWPENIDHDSSG
ncbi:hypothetical protein JL11_04250 [Brevundimonas sp. DS20]|nr:hypothetical protein JL11_04250 [Brevundimonas sp. DS20]EHN77470.1 hypothetical protein SMCF_3005 [Streptomyces coelicoflavus ZG0656]